MTTGNNHAPMLVGDAVLPPMEWDESTLATRERKPAKRKPSHRKTGNRFAELNNFVDVTMKSLTRNEMAVWFVLYRDCRNGIAETSQADIARRAGAAERTVRRVIRRLEQRGLVEMVYRGGLQRGVSKYRIRPLAEPP